MDAEKKIALITGASRGVGLATSLKLLEEGYQVIGLARNFTDCPINHENFIAKTIDLSRLETLPAFLKKLTKEFPSVTSLICNAGQWHFGNFEEMSFEQIRSLIDLNFLSQVYLTRAYIPLLKRHTQSNLIFVGSESARSGKRGQAIYSASKFALRGFAQAIRSECATSNLRVSLINPGLIQTDFYNSAPFSPGKDPTHHLLPSDIADLVFFLLESRLGAVFDELNLSPQKHRLDFSKKGATSKTQDPSH